MENSVLPIEFMPGARWNSLLLRVGGYLYRKNKEQKTQSGKNASYFACYDKLCSATLVKVENTISLGKHRHNHGPNFHRILRLKMENEIKKEVRKDTRNLREIFDEVSVKNE
jgi:hypothetical protein